MASEQPNSWTTAAEPDPACPFCRIDDSLIIQDSALSLSFRDRFPVSRGHTLVVPRRHVDSLRGLSGAEHLDLFRLVTEVQARLDAEFKPGGYNIGLNDGPAAGQTVMHVHVHVIPRYNGDTEDPRGGVRWIFPDKARYWELDP